MSVKVGARTLYELAIENGDRRILLAYCSNVCRRTILKVVNQHAPRLIALTGTQNIVFVKPAKDGATGPVARSVDRPHAARGASQ